MIQAVFFDLYETLITEWEDNKKKAAYSVEELGLDFEIYKKEWTARREMRMDGTFSTHQSVLEDILSSQGITADETVIKEIHTRRVQSKLAPFKDIDDEIVIVLKQLRMLNIKVGLISNCAPEEVHGWRTSRLADLFDDVVFSYRAGCAKPSPEIYHTACDNLGVHPSESLFVGDGGSDELWGASKVGMKAYQAAWYHNADIAGFPKLKRPEEILEIVRSSAISMNKQ
ncbi:HAD family hydrolase [Bacillus salacetis]|uniref:HAD family hydrolase n=1 Tax=Bacillus salacetis TaxID=2315464 RepID=A0A3A1QY30_9BACI|nr:HAD family hydrolase [Bacillus salacetis]RIW32056.1 HAD family hydrolase [Bacillus salacetis]